VPRRKKEDKRRRKEKIDEDTHQPVTSTPNHIRKRPWAIQCVIDKPENTCNYQSI
jgi:hypothetical protein